MEKRSILAFVLIIVLYLLVNRFFWSNTVPQNTTTTSSSETLSENTAADSSFVADAQLDFANLDNEEPEWTASSEPIQEQQFQLKNDELIATFSNVGANLVQLQLNHFEDRREGYETPYWKMLLNERSTNLRMQIGSQWLDWGDRTFVSEAFQDDQGEGIRFTAQVNEKIIICKEFYLPKTGYRMDYRLKVESPYTIDQYEMEFLQEIEHSETNLKDEDTYFESASMVNNEYEAFKSKKVQKQGKIDLHGDVRWASLRNKYFAAILLPDEQVSIAQLSFLSNPEGIGAKLLSNPQRKTIENQFSLYFGPLEQKNLTILGKDVDRIISSSILRPLSNLFVWILQWMYKLVPNYGIAIILFGILIKVLLSPLSHMQNASMHNMQKIQPQVEELKKKYANEPQRLNAETMKLYKEAGVNPLGGCLPMLLQMPVIFALYPALKSTVALRGAAFVFWIQDLSLPDPYYLIPALMSLSSFFMQKLTMQTSGPSASQQKFLLYGMPVMMFFIFRGLPAGLTLYWLVFNLVSGLHMLWFRRKKAEQK